MSRAARSILQRSTPAFCRKYALARVSLGRAYTRPSPRADRTGAAFTACSIIGIQGLCAFAKRMKQKSGSCPVCQGDFGGCQKFLTTGDRRRFKCDGCGEFEITGSAFAAWFEDGTNRLTAKQRSTLSHVLRTSGSAPLVLTSAAIEETLENERLPSRPTQAAKLIARIGDYVTEEDKGLVIDAATETPLIGAFDVAAFNRLFSELEKRGLIKPLGDDGVELTLAGWKCYQNKNRGGVDGDTAP